MGLHSELLPRLLCAQLTDAPVCLSRSLRLLLLLLLLPFLLFPLLSSLRLSVVLCGWRRRPFPGKCRRRFTLCMKSDRWHLNFRRRTSLVLASFTSACSLFFRASSAATALSRARSRACRSSRMEIPGFSVLTVHNRATRNNHK